MCYLMVHNVGIPKYRTTCYHKLIFTSRPSLSPAVKAVAPQSVCATEGMSDPALSLNDITVRLDTGWTDEEEQPRQYPPLNPLDPSWPFVTGGFVAGKMELP
jgi:hypothetical protein